jgi:hypothetical protein
LRKKFCICSRYGGLTHVNMSLSTINSCIMRECFLDAFAKLQKSTISFIMSPTGQIFMKTDIWVFFENLLRKLQFHQNLTRISATLHEDQHTLMVISRSVFLSMRSVSPESFRENHNTHYVQKNFFFWKSCRSCDNVEKYCKARRATVSNMAYAYCMLDT